MGGLLRRHPGSGLLLHGPTGLLVSGCTEKIGSDDCTNCAANCDDGLDIEASIVYRTCGHPECADWLEDGITMARVGACGWIYTGGSGRAIELSCLITGKWFLQVDVLNGTNCQGWINPLVFCTEGHPTGVFSVPISSFSGGSCGKAIVTLK